MRRYGAADDPVRNPRTSRVVESAGPILDQAALDAVRRWRFEPARKGRGQGQRALDVPSELHARIVRAHGPWSLTIDSKGRYCCRPSSTRRITTAPSRTERLQGNLELLILRTLFHQSLHGWAIARRLEEVSRSVLQVGQGSIYPALRRLEDQGWIAAEWGVSEAGRRARFYRLTGRGRRQLERERVRWEEFAEAVGRVLKLA